MDNNQINQSVSPGNYGKPSMSEWLKAMEKKRNEQGNQALAQGKTMEIIQKPSPSQKLALSGGTLEFGPDAYSRPAPVEAQTAFKNVKEPTTLEKFFAQYPSFAEYAETTYNNLQAQYEAELKAKKQFEMQKSDLFNKEITIDISVRDLVTNQTTGVKSRVKVSTDDKEVSINMNAGFEYPQSVAEKVQALFYAAVSEKVDSVIDDFNEGK